MVTIGGGGGGGVIVMSIEVSNLLSPNFFWKFFCALWSLVKKKIFFHASNHVSLTYQSFKMVTKNNGFLSSSIELSDFFEKKKTSYEKRQTRQHRKKKLFCSSWSVCSIRQWPKDQTFFLTWFSPSFFDMKHLLKSQQLHADKKNKFEGEMVIYNNLMDDPPPPWIWYVILTFWIQWANFFSCGKIYCDYYILLTIIFFSLKWIYLIFSSYWMVLYGQ